MKLALSLAAALALPVSADAPTFTFSIGCDGGLPVVIQVEAARAGMTRITLVEMLEFCAEARPEKQKWQGRT